MGWSKMVDMELTDEEKIDSNRPIPCPTPDYPYGLRLCLGEREIKKLKLDGVPDVGDLMDMRCFGTITSVSQEPGPDGEKQRRVEIQIERIAIEDEDHEETPG